MKISVIIPVDNLEKNLEECLNSVISQTLSDIEIICINYGSTDSSLNILNDYKKNHENIRIINQENKGLGAARNIAIKESKGEYIYFLDSDDYIDRNCLEISYKEAKKHNLDIVTFDAECFHDEVDSGIEINENYNRENLLIQSVVAGKEFYIISNKLKCYKASVWLNLYKAEFIKNNDLFFIEGIVHEDEIHTCQSFLLANRVKYIPYEFLKRRIRQNLNMTPKLYNKKVKGYFCASSMMYKLYIENRKNKNDELSDILMNNIRLFLSISISYCDTLNEFELRKEISKFIYNKKEVLNAKLDIQINKPNINYNIQNLKVDRVRELYLYKGIKKIFYMLTPTHGNLGDQAIIYASLKLLENKYPQHKIITINYEDTYLYTDIIRDIVNEGDFVALPGGGNMGNHYIWEEQARRYVISNIPNIPIISFPQTIYFTNDEEGQNQLEITKAVYNNHKRLTVMAREEISFGIMKDNFNNCNVLKCPDIVFYLNEKLNIEYENIDRKYITTCLRKDKESYYNTNDKELLVKYLKKRYDLIVSDTIVNYRVDGLNREEELINLWITFYKSKVVITDRLHGMIFAAITHTPCIVLRSLDYKVIESYKWIKDLNYIKFVDEFNIETIESSIKDLISINNLDKYYFDDKYFNNILENFDV